MRHFLKKIFRRTSIEAITIHNAIHCNFNCIYCYTKERRKGKNAVSIDVWKSVIHQARGLGAQYVYFAGPGESLMESSTFELVNYAHALKLQPIIATNGSFITPSMAKFLLSRGSHFFVKLPSLDPQIYQYLSGQESKVAWDYYEYSHKKRRKTVFVPFWLKVLLEDATLINASHKAKWITLEAAITKLNLHCLPAIAEFAKENKIHSFFETLIGCPSLQPSADEHNYLFRQLKKHLGRKFVEQQRTKKCWLRENPVIWEDGSMNACLVQPSTIGNIRNYRLEELWNKRCAVEERTNLKRRRLLFKNCPGREFVKGVCQEGLFTYKTQPPGMY